MPSPIAHLATGIATYQIATHWYSKAGGKSVAASRDLLLLATVYSMLPDVDAILGILSGDFGRYHNNVTHSFTAGVIAALLATWWYHCRVRRQNLQRTQRQWAKVGLWFLVALLCYTLHILMDAATIGRGVLLLWPYSSERIQLPIIFYGVRWSEGGFAWQHLWTLFTELTFTAILAMLVWLGLRWRRSSDRTTTPSSINQ